MQDYPHILIIDDDTRLRKLLKRYLCDHGFRVSLAVSAEDAFDKLKFFKFDLLVVDIMLPKQDGLDFVVDMRKVSAIPILLLTARGAPDDRIIGLEKGADDYLSKPFEPRELLLRLKNLIKRNEDNTKEVEVQNEVRFGRFSFDNNRQELKEGDNIIPLTSAEAVLLKILAQNAGSIVTRELLAQSCGLEGQLRAIDVQVTRLRKKVEEDSKIPHFIKTIRGQGYLLQTD